MILDKVLLIIYDLNEGINFIVKLCVYQRLLTTLRIGGMWLL